MLKTTQLSLHAVSKAYPGRRVLREVSFSVRPGERAGIVGENGSGKSTLLRLLAGAARPDSGEVSVCFPGGVGYLDQVLALPPEATVTDAAESALADLRRLEGELRRAEQVLSEPGMSEQDLARYDTLLTEFERRDGYTVDARLAETLDTLGVPGSPRIGGSASCPAVNGRGWHWPPCSPPTRNCCCSTNPPTTSTRKR